MEAVMSFQGWGYQFDGGYLNPDGLKIKAGVYVIWCRFEDCWTILDVGESDDVRWRLNTHERSACWSQNCAGTIYYTATYISDKNERVRLEKKIRNYHEVACGKK
jgi:hypothetical protein